MHVPATLPFVCAHAAKNYDERGERVDDCRKGDARGWVRYSLKSVHLPPCGIRRGTQCEGGGGASGEQADFPLGDARQRICLKRIGCDF